MNMVTNNTSNTIHVTDHCSVLCPVYKSPYCVYGETMKSNKSINMALYTYALYHIYLQQPYCYSPCFFLI